MKILDRYVLVSFLKNYVIALMVLLGLYIVLDMVFNFDQLVDVKGMQAEQGLAGAVQIIKGIVDYYFYQSFLIYAHLSGVIPVVAVAFTLILVCRCCAFPRRSSSRPWRSMWFSLPIRKR
jgi:lipopolysaccharide export LptBFGC system permease protein LptF